LIVPLGVGLSNDTSRPKSVIGRIPTPSPVREKDVKTWQLAAQSQLDEGVLRFVIRNALIQRRLASFLSKALYPSPSREKGELETRATVRNLKGSRNELPWVAFGSG